MFRARGLYVKKAEYAESKGFSEGVSHFHRHYEVYYLLQGRRRYIIENEVYDVEAGDVILVSPMTMHTTTYHPDAQKDEFHRRLLYNANEIPDELVPCFEKHFYRPDYNTAQKLKELAEESMHEIKEGNADGFLHRINAQKFLYLLKIMPDQPPINQKLSQSDIMMRNAALYIKENCEKNITLQDMAQQTGFSREYFSVVFKKTAGSNFCEYLNNMRIARALHLLVETDLPISRISEMCGFNDSNYFSLVFKGIAGSSPRQYRNAQK